jgi:hypothetical protein
MYTDTLTDAWATKTDFERYEQAWIAPRSAQELDNYQHQPYESGDSRYFASDAHPEDAWN